MDFVDPAVDRYAHEHTTPEPARLRKIAQRTQSESAMPAMLSGNLVATLLGILVSATEAHRVLEVGTFTGYSALAMAAHLPMGGELVTLEADEETARIARQNLRDDPHGEKIRIQTGDAHEILPGLDGPFDLAFLDADKEGYLDHWENLVRLIRPGGLIVVDNTLWSGRVVEPPKDDPATRGIHALNERVRDDPRVRAVLLTVRDGVTLAIREHIQ